MGDMKNFLELFGVALLAYGEMTEVGGEGLVVPVLANEGQGFKMIGHVDGNDFMRLKNDEALSVMKNRFVVPLDPGIKAEVNDVLTRNKEREA